MQVEEELAVSGDSGDTERLMRRASGRTVANVSLRLFQAKASPPSPLVRLGALYDGTAILLHADGRVRLWQLDWGALQQARAEWRTMLGLPGDGTPAGLVQVTVQSDKLKETKAPKVGKEDDKEHHGGNTYAGGTGGADTAGLGGAGGPYRLRKEKNGKVEQLSDEAKAQVSEEAAVAAKEMAAEALARRLEEIDMKDVEGDAYDKIVAAVAKEIVQLRQVLEATEAASREREWMRFQQDGEVNSV
jgi:hypothetical protein